MARDPPGGAARFDWVIVDTAPVGLLADANLLARMVDGALLVIRAGQTPHAVGRRAVESARPRPHPRRRPERRRSDGRRSARSTTARDSDDRRRPPRCRPGTARRCRPCSGDSRGDDRRWSSMDHVLIVAAVLLAVVVRIGARPIELSGWPLLWRAILIAGVLQICLHYCDLYDVRGAARSPRADRRAARRRSAPARSSWRCSTTGCPQLVIGRGIFLIGALFIVAVRRRLAASRSSGCRRGWARASGC